MTHGFIEQLAVVLENILKNKRSMLEYKCAYSANIKTQTISPY